MIEVKISADTQEEFDAKRADLAKAVIGPKAITPRKAYHRYQNDLLDYVNALYLKRIAQMKREIDVVIRRAQARIQ